jgi:hypothetical protein
MKMMAGMSSLMTEEDHPPGKAMLKQVVWLF